MITFFEGLRDLRIEEFFWVIWPTKRGVNAELPINAEVDKFTFELTLTTLFFFFAPHLRMRFN